MSHLNNIINEFLNTPTPVTPESNIRRDLNSILQAINSNRPTRERNQTPRTTPLESTVRSEAPPIVRDADMLFYIMRELNDLNRLFIQTPQFYVQSLQYNNSMHSLIELLKESLRRPTTQTEILTFEIPLTQSPLEQGLTPEQIQENVENVVYDTSMNEVRCPISMEDFTEGEDIYRIRSCQHIFKKQNLTNWLLHHTTCPVCRHSIITPTPNTTTPNNINFLQSLLRNIMTATTATTTATTETTEIDGVD
jgi:hypothetical protein